MRLGVMEILLILVLALVLFGGKRLSGVGKALGTSIREFKKEVTNEDESAENKSATEPKPDAEQK